MIIDKILTALHVLFSNLVTEIFKPSRHVEVYHTFFHLITMKKDIIKNFLFCICEVRANNFTIKM